MNISNYFSIFIMTVVVTVIISILVLVGFLIGLKKRSKQNKITPFESGFEKIETVQIKFDVRYYIVGVIGVLMSSAVVFFLPWALSLDSLTITAFFSVILFLLNFVIFYIYLVKNDLLNWSEK